MEANKIFSAVAPYYFEKNMPVMPLMVRDKRPIIERWQEFHNTMPRLDMQERWLKTYDTNNIGLVLGEQAGVVMLDIDTVDEDLQNKIVQVMETTCGVSPWKRRGSKGFALAYRFNPSVKTFRLKTAEGTMLVELLSSKTQMVLPPSIHPATKLPYEANCNLWEVVDDLPLLSDHAEDALRGLVKGMGVKLSSSGWTKVSDWVPAGQRDVTLTSVAGLLAMGVSRGEHTLLEAIGAMRAKCSDFFTEKVAGDEVDAEKHVQNLVKFVLRDVYEKNKILPNGWDLGLSDEEKQQMGLVFGEDQLEWTHDQLIEYLKAEFSEGNPSRSSAAIQIAVKRISNSKKSLSSLDIDRLMKYMADVSGLRLTTSAIRRQLRECEAGQLEGANHTEIAKAVLKDLEQLGEYRYHNSALWKWTGASWEEVDLTEIRRLIQDNYGHLEFARREGDHRAIIKIICDQQTGPLVTEEVSGVNFANGFLNEDGELLAHNSAFGMTYVLPYRWAPQAARDGKRWMQFLHDIWGQEDDYEERLKALQDAITMTVFGWGPRYEKAILLKGAAKSGKSTMLRIVEGLVSDNGKSSVPPDLWSDKFAPAQMRGKILNVCGELSETKKIDGESFKSIVSGEERAAQHKFQQMFRFAPICTHWFASNHPPQTKDTSAGFTRRWLVLTFDKVVDKDRVVPNLAEEIVVEEREAILAWAVTGGRERLIRNRGVTEPPSHVQAIEKIAHMNNGLLYFLQGSGRARVSPLPPNGDPISHRISIKELHIAYLGWCASEGGARPVSLARLREDMETIAPELGIRKQNVKMPNGVTEMYYVGLTLVDQVGLSNSLRKTG